MVYHWFDEDAAEKIDGGVLSHNKNNYNSLIAVGI